MKAEEYQISVTFTRNREDDLEAARITYPQIKDERQLLVLQLRDELQQYAYDEGSMAGSFDVEPSTYKELK